MKGVVVAGLVTLVPPLPAQESLEVNTRPWFADVSHVAKWPALAAAGGFIALAAARHGEALAVDREIETLCAEGDGRCSVTLLGSGPLFTDSEVQALHERRSELRNAARGYLLGGQISLVVSGGMFLLDLIYGDDRPKNIPFTPLELHGRGQEVGFRIRF
jgi:hypothetical protein